MQIKSVVASIGLASSAVVYASVPVMGSNNAVAARNLAARHEGHDHGEEAASSSASMSSSSSSSSVASASAAAASTGSGSTTKVSYLSVFLVGLGSAAYSALL
ncbi:hypothetical protein AYI70_g6182 [Smittium culicis]|uniref:Uncharacterized protein n=1 Tax=Smittium culicis TaxID=133412 RepID=A0A1R1XK67_9FUNG|nr:hypothetical protein AYI70_g7533 [Smittium culicis]OMJ17119.1 hypothetical protein AYI70_g6182 [Smittium culicis]